MNAPFLVEALGPGHDRAGFSSDVDALDRYFREQVTQEVRRRTTACYVALDREKGKVAGYYTLAAGSFDVSCLPAAVRKKLPQHPLPTVHLGRKIRAAR